MAVRVADTVISKQAVDHWVSVMAAGRPPKAGTPRYRALRSRATSFLIAAQWSLNEAADRGVAVSVQEVKRGLEERERAFPGGSSELHSFLRATGETVADVELEVKAQLAVAKLRRFIADSAPPITPARLASYYAQHRARYAVPEQREVWITNQKSAPAAQRVMRHIEADGRFFPLVEVDTFDISSDPIVQRRRGPLQQAIASAGLNLLNGPVHDRVDYFVFEVKKIVPAHRKTLSQVSNTIAKALTRQQRQQALAAFDSRWARKWSALTDCLPGYVVMPCRQYRGVRELKLGFGVQ